MAGVAAMLTAASLVMQYFLLTGQHDLARQVAVADRFNVLATQMASDRPIERIAGLYGLRDLSRERQETERQALRLISAHLVLNNSSERMGITERAVAAGMIAAISRDVDALGPSEPLPYDLSGVNLRGLSMQGLRSFGGYFLDATFEGSDLQGAILKCTNLTRAKFINAGLEEARFEAVLLSRSDFTGARGIREGTLNEAYWNDGEAPLVSTVTVVRMGDEAEFKARCRRG